MVVNPLQPGNLQSTSTPARRRIDVSVSDPTRPDGRIPSEPQTGTIQGVLTEAEDQAINLLFTSKKSAYDGRGGVRAQDVPGQNLDLQA